MVTTAWGMKLLRMNTARPPLDNRDVRNAIGFTLNREAILSKVMQGSAVSLSAIGLGEKMKPWWNEQAIHEAAWGEYQPEKAEALLDSLGYRKGSNGARAFPDGKPLQLIFILEGDDVEADAISRQMAQDLQAVGFEVTVTPVDNWDGWQLLLKNADYDLLLTEGWAIHTPYEFYKSWMSALGRAMSDEKTNAEAGRYFNPEADRLLEEFTQETDPLKQKQIVDQIEMLFVEDMPVIPLYQPASFSLYSTWRFDGFSDEEIQDYWLTSLPVLLNLKPK